MIKNKLKYSGLIIYILLLFFSNICFADDIDIIFKEANKSFHEENYEKAIINYRKLVNLGIEDVNVYYNLATAYSKAGKNGRAIQFYLRALKVDPGDEDAHYNLELVKEMLARQHAQTRQQAEIEDVSAWRALVERFALNEAIVLFIISYTIFWIILIIRHKIKKTNIKTIFSLLLPVIIIITLATGSIASARYYFENKKEAIVITENVEVIEGPQNNARLLFSIPEGERIEIIEKYNSWYKIIDRKKRTGWVFSRYVGLI